MAGKPEYRQEVASGKRKALKTTLSEKIISACCKRGKTFLEGSGGVGREVF